MRSWCVQLLMIGVPINTPLPAWRYYLVRPWLSFWTGLFLRAGLGFWPCFVGWKNYRMAQDERCVTSGGCILRPCEMRISLDRAAFLSSCAHATAQIVKHSTLHI